MVQLPCRICPTTSTIPRVAEILAGAWDSATGANVAAIARNRIPRWIAYTHLPDVFGGRPLKL